MNEFSVKKLPEWTTDEKIWNAYLNAHQKNWMDKLVIWIAQKLGIIVNGNFNNGQLEQNLAKFDIHKLLDTQQTTDSPILSRKAQQLILDCYADFKDQEILDTHIHTLGYDQGNYLNPTLVKGLSRFKFTIMYAACGIETVVGSAAQACQRLFAYAHNFPQLHGVVLPIEKAYTPEGKPDWKNTGSSLSNEFVYEAVNQYHAKNSRLSAAVSINPADEAWQTKLEDAYAKGIRIVKWMPPQGIKPDLEDYVPFYQALRDKQMVLLAHAGPEHAVPGPKEWEDYGNPLRFERALKEGVTLILAHSGHRDQIPDLENPNEKVPGHLLFARLAHKAFEEKWPGKLFADISAVHNHYGPQFVLSLLRYAQQPGFRFLHGSDFPYTNMIAPGNDPYPLLAKNGLLDRDIVGALSQIRTYNPLLANFICARSLRYQEEDGTILKFKPEVFTGLYKDAPLSYVHN